MKFSKKNFDTINTSQVGSVSWENQIKNKVNIFKTIAADVFSMKGFLQGFELEYSTVSQLTILPGACLDDSDDTILQKSTNTTIDITTNGAGGLDTGTEASDTLYYVFLIYNPSTDTLAGLLSTSHTTPTMPSGYTKKRLIGAIRNDDSSNITNFKQFGSSVDREFIYLNTTDNHVVINGSPSTTWTTVNVANFVPLQSRWAIINITAVKNATAASTQLRSILIREKNDTTITNLLQMVIKLISGTAHGDGAAQGLVKCDSNGDIEYSANTDDTTVLQLHVRGFRMFV